MPTAPRLGVMLALDGQNKLVARLSRWLQHKPMRWIALEGTLPPASARTQHLQAKFNVWMPPLSDANA